MVEHGPAGFHERIGIWALAAANGISQLGNTLTFLAVPWFVLQTTGSASRTGLASATFALAAIVSGLTIGNLIDRVGYRRMSILADALSGISVALIPTLYLLDWLTFWQVLVLIFLGAYFDTPARTARGALTPALAVLSRMPLERANSILRVAGVSGDIILGPALAGTLIVVIGEVNLLFIDAGTFALSILIVAFLIRLPAAASQSSDTAAAAESESRLDAFVAGFRFVLRDRVMGVVLPVNLLYSFVLSAYFGVILAVYVDEHLGNAAYFGVLITTQGVGMLLGTLIYGYFGHRYRRYTLLLATSPLSAGALWLFTVPVYYPTDLLAMFLFGMAGGPFSPLMRTIIQERTPEHLLGRVLNALFTLVAVAAPLGALTAGIAIDIDAIGLRTVQLAAATLITLVPLWFAFAPWPRRVAAEFER